MDQEEPVIRQKEKKQVDASEFIRLFSKYKKVINLKVSDKLEITKSEFFKLKESEIINCDFDDEVLIENTHNISSLLIVGCVFKKRLLLFNCKLSRIRFLRSKFNQHFAFKQFEVEKLCIEDCTIKNVRELKLHEFKTHEFIFKNNQADNDVHLKPLSIKKLFLEGSEKSYQITFSNLENKEILDEVYLFCYSSYKTDFLLRNFSAKKFQIVGELKDSMVFINNVKIQSGISDYFFNQGNLKITSLFPLTEKSILIIKNTAIGKAQISNCDFSNFNRIIISSSSIIDIIPVNISWCSPKNLQSNNTEALKENFRQLKLVAGKNEDLDKKLSFEKQEMQLLLDLIKNKKNHFIDKFILFTNYYSNNFGLSWLRAFYWLLGTTIVWYTSIKVLINQTEFDSSLIVDEIGKFLLFINPIHQFDKIFGVDSATSQTNGAILFDAISRIVGAYLIYQFISAFRKYSKR